jgi:hypothetical protein
MEVAHTDAASGRDRGIEALHLFCDLFVKEK